MTNDIFFGEIQFSVPTSLKPWGADPGQFVLPINGIIQANVGTEEQPDAQENIGKIESWLVLAIEAVNQRVNLYDVFDAHSGTLEAVYGAIFEGGDLKAELEIEPSWRNLLYVSSISIQDKYRQTPIGVQAVETAIAAFGSGSIIVADREELGLDVDEWKTLGFKKISQTTLAFRDNCTKNPYGIGLDEEE